MDWQTVAVVVIVAAAVAYLGAAAWRVVLGALGRTSGCATGCGSCSANESRPPAPGPALVRLTRSPRGSDARPSHDANRQQPA